MEKNLKMRVAGNNRFKSLNIPHLFTHDEDIILIRQDLTLCRFIFALQSLARN